MQKKYQSLTKATFLATCGLSLLAGTVHAANRQQPNPFVRALANKYGRGANQAGAAQQQAVPQQEAGQPARQPQGAQQAQQQRPVPAQQQRRRGRRRR